MLSARLRPIAFTRMRTSPAAGRGSETSLNLRTSGVPKDANSIGTQLSVTVSGRVQTVTDIRQLGDPEATDKALLASLPQSVRLSLREVREAEIDPRYGYDEVFKTFRLADALTPEARAAALRLVEAAMAPADKMTIAREVTRLRAMTKAKAEQEDDLKVLAALYSEDLRAYPTDVVVSVIRKWINREKWWPAWSELKAMLDEALRYRSALLKTLEEHHGA